MCEDTFVNLLHAQCMLVRHSDSQTATQTLSFNGKRKSAEVHILLAAYLASDEFRYNSDELKIIQKTNVSPSS